MARFYGYFAAAYGTIWLVMLLYAALDHFHVYTPEFGIFTGVPLLGFLYAVIRMLIPTRESLQIAELRDHIRQLEARLAVRDQPRPHNPT
jgi:hypothetical protein